MKNYYSILGVTPDSTAAEIKAAYRRLARKFHPDINPNGGNMFKDITEAYETLSDDKKKLQYDTINGFFKSAPKYSSTQNAQKEYQKQTQINEHEKTSPKEDFSKKITVKIPKNVKNGTKLRIPGEGNNGENGGKNGDLFLKIKIEPNSRVAFDGNNIIYSIPITPFEAVLGGKISIPSFDGNLTLKLPSQTHSGQKFRLAGQGLKQNGKIGDMIINVHIEIPCSLSDDEIRLYEKLKKLSTQSIRENLLNE